MKGSLPSYYGVACAIEYYSWLVIEFEIMSLYCHRCVANKNSDAAWHLEHKKSGKCCLTYTGSPGGMDV